MNHTNDPWSMFDAGNDIHLNEKDGPGFVGSIHVYEHRAEECRENARRIVACVNACAGIETELLEIVGDNDKTLTGVIADLERQRDQLQSDISTLEQESRQMRARMERLESERNELLAALEQFATWGRMQHKAQSKGCHATFDMLALRDEIELAEAAISAVQP